MTYKQTQFGFGKDGELLTGNYTGKFVKQQPKIKTLKNEFKNPAKVEEYSDKEFLELAVCTDTMTEYKTNKKVLSRPTLSVTHKNWSADGFRLHLLTNIQDGCKCKYCKKHESPDYHVLIPRGFKGEFTINRDAFLQALNSCEIFTREGSNVVKLYIMDEHLKIVGQSEETGQSTHFIDGDNYSKVGIELFIGFNVRFLIDAVKSMGEKITVKYNGKTQPAMFVSGNRSALIMPMNLG